MKTALSYIRSSALVWQPWIRDHGRFGDPTCVIRKWYIATSLFCAGYGLCRIWRHWPWLAKIPGEKIKLYAHSSKLVLFQFSVLKLKIISVPSIYILVLVLKLELELELNFIYSWNQTQQELVLYYEIYQVLELILEQKLSNVLVLSIQ